MTSARGRSRSRPPTCKRERRGPVFFPHSVRAAVLITRCCGERGPADNGGFEVKLARWLVCARLAPWGWGAFKCVRLMRTLRRPRRGGQKPPLSRPGLCVSRGILSRAGGVLSPGESGPPSSTHAADVSPGSVQVLVDTAAGRLAAGRLSAGRRRRVGLGRGLGLPVAFGLAAAPEAGRARRARLPRRVGGLPIGDREIEAVGACNTTICMYCYIYIYIYTYMLLYHDTSIHIYGYMYICIYTYTYIYIYIYIHINIHTHNILCMYASSFVSRSISLSIYIYIYMYVCMHVCIYMCIYIYIYIEREIWI